MTQMYVVEIQKMHSGEYAHNVFWVYDENATICQQKGEAKYREILSYAAVSDTAEHAAILFTSEGFPLMNQCYKHDPIPTEEPVVSEAEE